MPKQPKRWLPLLVAIVAFLSISVLVASLLQQNGTDSSSSETESGDAGSTRSTDEAQMEQAEPPEAPAAESDGAASLATEESEALRTAVYESDLEHAHVLRIGLAYQGYVVP